MALQRDLALVEERREDEKTRRREDEKTRRREDELAIFRKKKNWVIDSQKKLPREEAGWNHTTGWL